MISDAEWPERISDMKTLWTGIAVAASLAIAAPVWAQTNPSAGNPVGTLGPNPGGPGLTPYTGGVPAPAANSATPPAHHAVRHARAMHAHHRHMAAKAALTGDTTAQLNREELARIQSGNLSNPSAPPGPPGAGPGAGGPGPAPYSPGGSGPPPGGGAAAPPGPPPH